jgi:hypothetical protein
MQQHSYGKQIKGDQIFEAGSKFQVILIDTYIFPSNCYSLTYAYILYGDRLTILYH